MFKASAKTAFLNFVKRYHAENDTAQAERKARYAKTRRRWARKDLVCHKSLQCLAGDLEGLTSRTRSRRGGQSLHQIHSSQTRLYRQQRCISTTCPPSIPLRERTLTMTRGERQGRSKPIRQNGGSADWANGGPPRLKLQNSRHSIRRGGLRDWDQKSSKSGRRPGDQQRYVSDLCLLYICYIETLTRQAE